MCDVFIVYCYQYFVCFVIEKKFFVYLYLGKIFIFNFDYFGVLELLWLFMLILIYDDEEDFLVKFDFFVYIKNNLYLNVL